jgi:glucosamine--fructose-6-phosphate aminotransferase (isomerizing)
MMSSHPRKLLMKTFSSWIRAIRELLKQPVYFGKITASLPNGAICFFPLDSNMLGCGIAALVARRPLESANDTRTGIDQSMGRLSRSVSKHSYAALSASDDIKADRYLGGSQRLDELTALVNRLKTEPVFRQLFQDEAAQSRLREASDFLVEFIRAEGQMIAAHIGQIPPEAAETVSQALERLKDVQWGLSCEVLDNVPRIQSLIGTALEACALSAGCFAVYRQLNAVLNSLDRLEVRGRDSAGISLMLTMAPQEAEGYRAELEKHGLEPLFQKRCHQDVLVNRGISLGHARASEQADAVSLAFTYKVAAEVGHLGDNVTFLRDQIRSDEILHRALLRPVLEHSMLTHTRWASVGAINSFNCHPVDARLMIVPGGVQLQRYDSCLFEWGHRQLS